MMKQVVTLRELGRPSAFEMSRIEAQHRALDDRLRELGRHSHLTPLEEREVSEIKKQKLRVKDQIAAFRREV